LTSNHICIWPSGSSYDFKQAVVSLRIVAMLVALLNSIYLILLYFRYINHKINILRKYWIHFVTSLHCVSLKKTFRTSHHGSYRKVMKFVRKLMLICSRHIWWVKRSLYWPRWFWFILHFYYNVFVIREKDDIFILIIFQTYRLTSYLLTCFS
jgi:hypothetical protein